MRFTLWKKIITALAAGLCALVLVAAAAFWSANQLSHTFQWVDHTHRVLLELEKLQHNILNGEAATRAYALTRDEPFLLSRQAGQEAAMLSLDRLDDQLHDNPVQLQRLRDLKPLVSGAFDLMNQPVAAHASTEMHAGKMQQLKTQVDRIRLSIAAMEAQQRTLLQQRSAASWQLIERTQRFIALALLSGLVLMCVMVYFVRRELIERRQARLRLKAANEEILDLYNRAPCGYHSLDGEGVVSAINDTELKWLGYTRDEVVGKMRITDILTPASGTMFASHFEAFKKSGRISGLECELRCKNGSVLTVAVSATAIYDAAGQFQSSRSTVHDIRDRKRAELIARQLNAELEQKVKDRTLELENANHLLRQEIEERKRLEQAARESEEFSRQVISGALEGISVFDRDLRYQVFNPFMEKLTSWKEADVLGKTLEEAMPTPHAIGVMAGLRRALQGETNYSGDRHIPASAYGPERWVSSKESPLRNVRGEIIGVISILNDISVRKQSEVALREAAEFTAQVIEGIESGIAVFDRNLNYRAFNPFLERLTGWKASAVIGKNVAELITEEHAADTRARLQRALQGEIVYSGDRHVAASHDHPELWATSRASPLHDANGAIVGVIMTITDISERKRAEQAIVQSTTRRRVLFDQATDAICILNPARKLVDANASFARMLGYAPEEVQALHVWDWDARYSSRQEILASWPDGPPHEELIQTQWRRRDGSIIDVEISTNPAQWEGEEMVFCVSRDITRRKRTEGLLDLQKRIFEKIASGAALAEVLADIAIGVEQQLTGVMCSILLLEADGMHLRTGAGPSLPAGYNAAVDGLSIGAGIGCCGTAAFRKEMVIVSDIANDPLWADYRELAAANHLGACWSTPILSSADTGRNLLGTFALYTRAPSEPDEYFYQIIPHLTNLTAVAIERKQAEARIIDLNANLELRIKDRTRELDAKTKELESFCYSVSHDLKAPLRGIDGYSRLLLEDFSDRLDEDGRKFLNNVRSATLRMTDLIDDLLTYSRQERRALVAARIDLFDLVTDQIQKREMDMKNMDLVLEVEHVDVVADYEGLMVAFRNLLDNAIKFSSRSAHPSIRIRTQIAEGHCVLEVRDNGVGFDMRFYDRIFEIFQRLHRAEDYPGTGIGLALVRKAMQRMGGKVWAEAQPGQGASFYLEIPLYESTPKTKKAGLPGARI